MKLGCLQPHRLGISNKPNRQISKGHKRTSAGLKDSIIQGVAVKQPSQEFQHVSYFLGGCSSLVSLQQLVPLLVGGWGWGPRSALSQHPTKVSPHFLRHTDPGREERPAILGTKTTSSGGEGSRLAWQTPRQQLQGEVKTWVNWPYLVSVFSRHQLL